MSTISGAVTIGITLSTGGAYSSPLTITDTGSVQNGGTGDAIYGPGTASWTIANFGQIVANGGGSSGYNGVALYAGGSVENSGYIAASQNGIYIGGSAGTVTNSGTIEATNTIGFGICLYTGGTVSNNGYIKGGVFFGAADSGLLSNSGTIAYAAGGAVYLYGGGTVINTGTIAVQANSYYAVLLTGASTLSNQAGGYIYGGIYASGGPTTIDNAGSINHPGTNAGVHLAGNFSDTIVNSGVITAGGTGIALVGAAHGTVINSGHISGLQGIRLGVGGADLVSNTGQITATGSSGIGISLAAGGTVIDAGTITGNGGTAVSFGGTGASLMEIANGYKLNGSVIGSGSASNTLELLGTVGNAVTADYSGLGLSNFQDVLFGSGGNATLDVDATSGTLPLAISGFDQSGDVIDLTMIGTNGTIASHTASEVTVTGSLGSVTLTLDGSDAATLTTASDNANGTDLSIACYRRGTRIRTDRGDLPIEELSPGDRVITLSGEAQPIRWIGRRSYQGRFIAGNRRVLPIRICAGAFADGMPARDLWVSPGHSMLLDGVMVLAEYLLNGATIVQEERVEELEYLHIELDQHAILLAEGAPSESYVDCDNRLMFANGAEYERLYPNDRRPRWAFCAPHLDWEGPQAVAIRARLIDRAAALGHPLTLDPDLHLVADGVAIAPQAVDGARYRFAVPGGSAALSLSSRSAVPAEVDACSRDRRRLGVPVERICLYDDADFLLEAAHGHAALRDGFHRDEDTHRWTDGLARLPDWWVRGFTGAFTLEIHLVPSLLAYRLPTATLAALAG
jgi:Hint domain-containing protein